jgi:predicted flap endonuclease-1-like 5' DNA nuclease
LFPTKIHQEEAMTSIADIEGVGDSYAEKLKAAGIKNYCLKKVAHPQAVKKSKLKPALAANIF